MDASNEKPQQQYSPDSTQQPSQTPYQEATTSPAPSYSQRAHVTSAAPVSSYSMPQQHQPQYHQTLPQHYPQQPQQSYPQQMYPQHSQQYPSQPQHFQQYPQQQPIQPAQQYHQTALAEKPTFVQHEQPVSTSQFRQAVPIPALGRSGAPVDCPSCGQRKMTTVSYHSGNTTHLWAGILCCLTGFLCFVPYAMNSMKDVEHRCSGCGILLATWHKSGSVDAHAHA